MQGRAVAFIPSQETPVYIFMERFNQDDDFGIPSPNLYIICLWITALASGRYNKVCGRLRRTDHDPRGGGFCASGLACEIIRGLFPDNYAWETSGEDARFLYNRTLDPKSSLSTDPPKPVKIMTGMHKKVNRDQFASIVSRHNEDVGRRFEETYTKANGYSTDTAYLSGLLINASDLGVSFREMADVLADVYRELLDMTVPEELVARAVRQPANRPLREVVDEFGITKHTEATDPVLEPVEA